MAGDRNEINFTYGAMLGKIIKFAVPLMLSGILQLLFNSADMIVVGKFSGDHALASVSATSTITNLLINLFIGLSLGATVTVSRYFGKGHGEGMQKSAHTAVTLSFLCGLFLAVLGNILAVPLLKFTGVPTEILPYSTLYLRIIFAGMPFNMLYNFSSGIMRAYGDTKKPFLYLSIAGVINVCLNLFFVIVCHMSVEGVATATITAQAISAFLVLRALTKVDNGCRIHIKKLCIHKEQLKMILAAGIPSGLQSCMFSISNILIQSSINSFGANVIAGSGAGGSIEGYVYVSMNAFGNAAVTMSSQNYGAHKIRRILKGWLLCLACVSIAGVLVSWTAVFFSKPLVGLFVSNPEVIAIGMERLFYIGILYFLCGCMEVSTGVTRGMGYYIHPMIISVFGVCVFRVLWIYTAFAKIHTLPCLYISYPISWILTFLIQSTIFVILVNKKIKSEKEYENLNSIS